MLRDDQFVEVQAARQQAGLPRDLYHPERLARQIAEPARVHGGVVRAYHLYSPLRWSQRAQEAHVQVPDEDERIRRFSRASKEYIEAILLRIAELRESGRAQDRQQIERLAQLLHAINRVMHEKQLPPES